MFYNVAESPYVDYSLLGIPALSLNKDSICWLRRSCPDSCAIHMNK